MSSTPTTRAPQPREQWAQMSPEERARIVQMLPSSPPMALQPPPEGDPHRKAKQSALGSLYDFFRRAGRRIYLSSELSVYYSGVSPGSSA
jgi:hypothetical protein